MAWTRISLCGLTNLHVFHRRTLTGARYRKVILDTYVCPYAGAIGNNFILINDKAQPRKATIVEDYLEGHDLKQIEWSDKTCIRLNIFGIILAEVAA